MSDRTITASACVAALLALGLTTPTGVEQSKPGPPPPPPPLTVLWQRVLTLPVEATEAPQLAAGDSILFLTGPKVGLAAYAPDDGHEVWSTTFVSSLPATPFGDRVAVASNGVLSVVSQNTHEELWHVDLPEIPSAMFAFGDRLGGVLGKDVLTWSATGEPGWRTPLGGAPTTRVVFRNGMLYVGLDEPSLVAIEVATGAVKWRIRMRATPQSLTATDDRLYAGAADGALYCYSTSGAAKWHWRFRILGTRGEPTVDERFVYFALLDNSVRAFDRKGGSQRWKSRETEIDARPKFGPILMGPSLAIALESGHVAELTTKDGRLRPPATPPPLGGTRLQSIATSGDGSRLFTMTTSKDGTRTLSAWGRAAPKASR